MQGGMSCLLVPPFFIPGAVDIFLYTFVPFANRGYTSRYKEKGLKILPQ